MYIHVHVYIVQCKDVLEEGAALLSSDQEISSQGFRENVLDTEKAQPLVIHLPNCSSYQCISNCMSIANMYIFTLCNHNQMCNVHIYF